MGYQMDVKRYFIAYSLWSSSSSASFSRLVFQNRLPNFILIWKYADDHHQMSSHKVVSNMAIISPHWGVLCNTNWSGRSFMITTIFSPLIYRCVTCLTCTTGENEYQVYRDASWLSATSSIIKPSYLVNWGQSSFCWYWWYWCPSLFKLSFHNYYIIP